MLLAKELVRGTADPPERLPIQPLPGDELAGVDQN